MKGTVREVTPLEGISYFFPPADAVLEARDGRVSIPYGDIPIPLLMEDHEQLDGQLPSYDAIGRGIYQALRINPDCLHAYRYALLIREAYPHILSELIIHLAMLDKKAVDIAYLDRKIAALKVLALLQEDDYRIPFEIGRCFLEKGTTLALAHRATVNLYAALDYLGRAAAFNVPDSGLMLAHAETCYLLGRYDQAGSLWSAMLDDDAEADPRIGAVLEALARREIPRIAPVDYLEAAGVALDLHRQEEYEEAGAILTDILADELFVAQFPLPQLHCLLADCCRRLGWTEHARESFGRALAMDPTCREAAEGLAVCGGAGGQG